MDLRARLMELYWRLPSRAARRASFGWNCLKTLAQSLVIWLAFLLVGPFLIWRLENWLLTRNWTLARFDFPFGLALLIFGAGWFLAWWSAFCLIKWGEGTPLPIDATVRLVVRGPYRWVRNPMACGSLLQCAAIGLWRGSPLIVFYALAGGVLWNYAVRPWEEADMGARFGADFEKYRQRVRCWIPRVPRNEGRAARH